MICVALQPINLSNQPAKKIERKSVIPSHIVIIQKAKMVNKEKKNLSILGVSSTTFSQKQNKSKSLNQ